MGVEATRRGWSSSAFAPSLKPTGLSETKMDDLLENAPRKVRESFLAAREKLGGGHSVTIIENMEQWEVTYTIDCPHLEMGVCLDCFKAAQR